ncbi:MAG: hypothetical protein KGI52_03485 [Burkholderiales bacterium]|nr:hypothetical protein [Burkholderiales bacterium]
MTENQKLRDVLQRTADFLLLLPSNDGYDDARYECIESLTEALALPTADHREAITMEAIIQQYSIDCDDANWLRSLLPSVATQTTTGKIVPTAEQPNLSDPAVQKRLAAQWGYVLPTAAPVDEREAFEAWFDAYHSNACAEFGGIDCTNPKGVAEDAWQARASLQSGADAVLAERERGKGVV